VTRHRWFVVPTRADVALDEAIDHWERRHGAVFAATPGLGGYVQHQPTRAEQRRLGGIVCAEAWFADADAEAAAFATDHYRGAVTTDEHRFVDRDRAWAPLVRAEMQRGTVPAHLPVEVVAVGIADAAVEDLADDVAIRLLTVDRPPPDGGHPRVLVATVSGPGAARDLADHVVADLVFVADRNPVLPPT
jgi:hypothetical protein